MVNIVFPVVECQYDIGEWSECDTSTNKRTRVKKLKKGDLNVCKPEIAMTKSCSRPNGKGRSWDQGYIGPIPQSNLRATTVGSKCWNVWVSITLVLRWCGETGPCIFHSAFSFTFVHVMMYWNTVQSSAKANTHALTRYICTPKRSAYENILINEECLKINWHNFSLQVSNIVDEISLCTFLTSWKYIEYWFLFQSDASLENGENTFPVWMVWWRKQGS